MAEIDLKKHNKKLITSLKTEIKDCILREGDTQSFEEINGNKVLTSKKNDYNELNKLLSYLDVEPIERSNIDLFEGFAIEKTKFNEAKTLCHQLAKKYKTILHSLPEIIQQDGIIEGLNIRAPRDKYIDETIDDYESFLESYYQAAGINKKMNDNSNLRKPYPHELCIWSNGVGVISPDKKSHNKYYLNYKAFVENQHNNTQGNNNNGNGHNNNGNSGNSGNNGNNHNGNDNNNDNNNTNDNNTRNSDSGNSSSSSDGNTQTEQRTTRRHYVKRKRQGIGAILDIPHNIHQGLNNEENWQNLKKILIRCGIAVGAIALGALAIKLILPIIAGLLEGIVAIPGLTATAITGAGVVPGTSTALTAIQVARIRNAFFTALATFTGISATALYVRYQRKKNGKYPHEKAHENSGNSGNGGNGGNSGNGNPTQPNTPEDENIQRINFLKAQILKLKRDLNALEAREESLKHNPGNIPANQTELNNIKTQKDDIIVRIDAYIEQIEALENSSIHGFQNGRGAFAI